VSNQGTNLEEFLDNNPWMRKWVHECVSCHVRGHKPELRVSQYDHTAVTITKLRRLVDEMVLDEAGVCEQCRQVAGQATESPEPSSGLKPARIVCDERERLNAAYRDAMLAKGEFESRISAEIVSTDPNVSRRAKRELKRAQNHYYRFMRELMAHEKKHGCGS